MKTPKPLLLAAIVCVLLQSPAMAIQILGDDPTNGTYSAARHDRYYSGVDKDFIGSPLDLSGVSHSELTYGTFGTWATMISDTHFITVAHFPPSTNPSNPGRVSFYRDNDPLSPYWQGDVIGGAQVGTADLWVGQLASAPPAWVRRYPLLKRPETINYLGLSGVSEDFFMVGTAHSPNPYPPLPPSPTGGRPNVMRVGQNSIDYFEPASIAGAGDRRLISSLSSAGQGFLDDEALSYPGDSGGPSFTVVPASGITALAGVHKGTFVDISASSYVEEISTLVEQRTALAPEHVSVVTDLAGDFNADFLVDGDDFNILAYHYNTSGRTYSEGDANGDGNVDGDDYALLAFNYNKTLRSPADFNKDWRVDKLDFAVMASHWNQTVPIGTLGDANRNGTVDTGDVNVMNSTWLFHYPESDFPSSPIDLPGDYNEDDRVNSLDGIILVGEFTSAAPPNSPYDWTADGIVNWDDAFYLYTLYRGGIADFDGDGMVYVGDLQHLLDNLHSSGSLDEGDLTGDGYVDADDIAAMGQYWGYGVTYSALPDTQLVPECTTARYCALIACHLLVGMRSRSGTRLRS